jgi:hypothetical protein
MDFNKVPGMQFCTDCAAALSPGEVAALKARTGVVRRPVGMGPNEYVFPDKCCSCLGPAETKMTITASRNEGVVQRTVGIQVPVCRSCAKRDKISVYFLVGGIVLGAVIGLAAGGVGGLIGGGFMGFLGGALIGYLAAKIAAPASVTMSGSISFRNPKYEALFKAANSRA